MKNDLMKILFVGGGSGGPVAPLLSVAREISRLYPRSKLTVVGTRTGPERQMAEYAGVPFLGITAGKWRRHFSLSNLLTPFQVLWGMYQSARILREFKPDCVFGAGSFVQVPVIWTACLMNIPVVIHQQDIIPSLANRLCQFCASFISVTFEQSVKDFSTNTGLFYNKKPDKVTITGNPFREELSGLAPEQGKKQLRLRQDMPTLLVVGGGTGASALNALVRKALPDLVKTAQVIHITGGGKKEDDRETELYRPFEFLRDLGPAYAAADVVLCRAGLATITELSHLEKVAIVVPMPDSHQEFNAEFLARRNAAVVVPQKLLTPEVLLKLFKEIIFDQGLQETVKRNISGIMPKDGAKKIAELLVRAGSTSK